VFAFDNCGDQCTLDQHPVAAGGAHTTIDVNGVDFASVRSSNPSVATFTKNGNKIEVNSGIAGSTTLEIDDAKGNSLAAAVLTVEDTAMLKPNLGVTTTPVVLEGAPLVFHVTTYDSAGKVTKGDGSVQFQLGGTLTAAVAKVDGDAIG